MSVASIDALDQTLAQAKDRPVILDLYVDWCVTCKEFKRCTFSNPQAQQALSNIVLLQADVTANNAQDVTPLKHLQILGLPTILSFDTEGREHPEARVTGFMDATTFNAHLRDRQPWVILTTGSAGKNTVQHEDVLGETLKLLEVRGIANTALEIVAERIDYPLDGLQRFWPDKEAILYDALCYLSQRVDIWWRQFLLDDTLSVEQRLLIRYTALSECASNNRYPGCLLIAACTFYPDPGHPIHQLVDQQKGAVHDFTHELLATLGVGDPVMVAKQIEPVLENYLSRMLVNRSHANVEAARRLAGNILRFVRCRMSGVLT